uniref:TIR domain-containing protein n=1 Tax=Mesocestoides corti TaxID=53468 RepID=A0A5K3FVQ4_MESCO
MHKQITDADTIDEEVLFYCCVFASGVDYCHLASILRSGFFGDVAGKNLDFSSLLNPVLELNSALSSTKYNTSFHVLLVRAISDECNDFTRTDVQISNTTTNPSRLDSAKVEPCACSLNHANFTFTNGAYLVPEFIVELELIADSQSSQFFGHVSSSDLTCPPVLKKAIEDKIKLGVARDTRILKTPPEVPLPPDLSEMSLEGALRLPWFARVASLPQCSITEINLHGTGFRSLNHFGQLPALKALILSDCGLSSLDGLSLPTLELLDLSHNSLNTLKSMGMCPSLLQLDVNWNLLSDLESEMRHLRAVTKKLAVIKIECNPWLRCERVLERAWSLLPSLSRQSGVTIGESTDSAGAFMLNHLFSTSKHYMLTLWPILYSLPRHFPSDTRPLEWFLQSTKVFDNSMSSIPSFSPIYASTLSALSINNAYLTDLSSLSSLNQLQELSIEDNCLTSLHGIHHLHNLKTLLAGNNSITSISNCGLNQLKNLQVLALDNNQIDSLNPLGCCSALKQLYLSGNKISSYQCVLVLGDLLNLDVLDLRFNALTTQLLNYRLRTIYRLPHLIFLDGLPVSHGEINEARDTFDGRLTTEYLLASLGIDHPSGLTRIDYEDNALRRIDLFPPDAFVNLHTVNLQNNKLTSLDGLLDLRSVQVLLLSDNRIACLTSNASLRDSRMDLLPNLSVLSLAGNGIQCLKSLQLHRFPLLHTLFLQENSLTSVSGLEGARNLLNVVLDKNKIRKLTPEDLVTLRCLIELHLESNRLRDLPSLGHLEQLVHLFLGDNRLDDLDATIEKLSSLTRLTHLVLSGNPVSKVNSYRLAVCYALPRLKFLDAVDISERELQLAFSLYGGHESPASSNSALEFEVPLVKRTIRSLGTKVLTSQLCLPPVAKLGAAADGGGGSGSPTALAPPPSTQQADNVDETHQPTTSALNDASPKTHQGNGDTLPADSSPLIVTSTSLLKTASSVTAPFPKDLRLSVAKKKSTGGSITLEFKRHQERTPKNDSKRVVMSIPGISINAMANISSQLSNLPCVESYDLLFEDER